MDEYKIADFENYLVYFLTLNTNIIQKQENVLKLNLKYFHSWFN